MESGNSEIGSKENGNNGKKKAGRSGNTEIGSKNGNTERKRLVEAEILRAETWRAEIRRSETRIAKIQRTEIRRVEIRNEKRLVRAEIWSGIGSPIMRKTDLFLRLSRKYQNHFVNLILSYISPYEVLKRAQ